MVEWRSLCAERHSVLLEGPDKAMKAALVRLTPHLSEPVAWARPGARFEPPIGECGALVLQDVGALDFGEQARLLAWLDDPSRRPQVIATTVYPLFPLVACGRFDEVLYYRLSVMLLHVDDAFIQFAY
jgi:hypothetical protein